MWRGTQSQIVAHIYKHVLYTSKYTYGFLIRTHIWFLEIALVHKFDICTCILTYSTGEVRIISIVVHSTQIFCFHSISTPVNSWNTPKDIITVVYIATVHVV